MGKIAFTLIIHIVFIIKLVNADGWGDTLRELSERTGNENPFKIARMYKVNDQPLDLKEILDFDRSLGTDSLLQLIKINQRSFFDYIQHIIEFLGPNAVTEYKMIAQRLESTMNQDGLIEARLPMVSLALEVSLATDKAKEIVTPKATFADLQELENIKSSLNEDLEQIKINFFQSSTYDQTLAKIIITLGSFIQLYKTIIEEDEAKNLKIVEEYHAFQLKFQEKLASQEDDEDYDRLITLAQQSQSLQEEDDEDEDLFAQEMARYDAEIEASRQHQRELQDSIDKWGREIELQKKVQKIIENNILMRVFLRLKNLLSETIFLKKESD